MFNKEKKLRNAEAQNKCHERIRSINDKLIKETDSILTYNKEQLINKLELISRTKEIWEDLEIDQLRTINRTLTVQSIDHEKSIALCKCAKDLGIVIPDNIESPHLFQIHILGNVVKKGRRDV